MKIRFPWLLKLRLAATAMISRFLFYETGYSLSLSSLRQLVYFCLLESSVVAPISNVFIIYGVWGAKLVALILALGT
jgi:hypothetical protein